MLLLAFSFPARALDPDVVRKLAFGESDEQVAAVAALVAEGDAQAAALLQALADGELQTAGKRVLIVKGENGVDAVTGAKSRRCPPSAKTSTPTTACGANWPRRWPRSSWFRPTARCALPPPRNLPAAPKTRCCRC